ncbi:MAG: hypothetical protein FJ104_13590, partial [Deltaproteobacteria bacterium]|nr:hypothetical protein [Deltaproteobacteria bacterium]
AERALRAVARAVELGGLLDAELGAARLHDTQLSAGERVAAAQDDALATFVRGTTLAGVIDAWGDGAPPGVTRRLVDVFGPAESGFRAALEGATVFGVPEGFVPFLREAGRSNFDAVHASIAPLLDELDADHARFVESDRAFEAAEDQLDRELEAVRDGLTVQLEELCGAPLEPPPAPGDAARDCHAAGGGRLKQVWLDIAEAAARVEVAEGRARAQAEKIRVVEERVAAVSDVREGTIRFTAATGEQLAATILAESALNAMAAFIDVAAQAQVLNFGTPIGMAGWAAVVELQRGAIAYSRQQLETAQTLRLQQDEALVEQIHGLSEVRGMVIDLQTIVLESALASFGVARARLELENLVTRAERLVTDREESMQRIGESSLRDPTFRVLRGRHAERALASRAAARRGLVLAGRALEYELGRSLGSAIPEAVAGAFDAAAARSLANCYQSISDGAEMSRQAAQAYVTELSLRERLGVRGPRPDVVTGRTLSAGEQFRALVRREGELDAERGLSVRFTSALDPSEGLWPANLCDDRIVSVEAQLVGDRLGDAEAQVVLELDGGGLLRACDDDQVHVWSTGGAAVLQAGVNAYPSALEPNGSLSGLPVASSRFRLRVPGGGEAPANADVDLTRVDDVVLRVRHAARPPGSTGLGASLECLARSGVGR